MASQIVCKSKNKIDKKKGMIDFSTKRFQL